MTKQPIYKLIANLGDANPFDHGGYFIYVDTTGVYPPVAEWLDPDDPSEARSLFTVYRFDLDPCTFINGVLSDNRFHPDHPAWFASPESERADRPQDTTYLSDLASSVGIAIDNLVAMFCSDDPLERAEAWRAVGLYHGFHELDHYPLTDLSRADVEKRYESDLESLTKKETA